VVVELDPLDGRFNCQPRGAGRRFDHAPQATWRRP
jgi:hypothetical protein